MSGPLHVVRAGVGPRLLLIHGSAADHATWSMQLGLMKTRFAMVAYDRRSTETVESEAADAATLLEPGTIVVGSSYGAVVALELARHHPVAGLVLIEPPLAPRDDVSPAAAGFLGDFDRIAGEQGGEAAARFFLVTVLGEPALARMPAAFVARAVAKWAAIRADCAALIAYRPRYASLRALEVPCLLVGGGRSAPYFRPTLDALAAALPQARLEIVEAAGHMVQAEAFRRFAELLGGFAEACRVA